MRRNEFGFGSLAAVAAFTVPSRAFAATPVSVLYAGSLVTVFERRIVPALAKTLDVRGEGKGSVALANLIASGLRSPDVFISADSRVMDDLLAKPSPPLTWYAIFAATRLVLGYAPASPFAADFVRAGRGEKKLADVLLSPGMRLGRTDPALDPKGYRTILAAQLLEAGGAPAGFATHLLGEPRNAAQIFPEETLLARLETGDLDAAFLYATESVARALPAIELPAFANLGDPAHAVHYATSSVTVDGVKRRGGLAAYALAVLRDPPNPAGADAFVAFLLSGAGRTLLESSGVTVLRPMLAGDRSTVPAHLRGLFATAP